MSELIDRQAAIRATWQEPSYTDPLNVLTEVRDRINALPTIPAPRWHRVDEELPPPNKTVLVCKIWGDVNGEPHKVITMDSFTISPSDSVIAWMPLPEPPKEDA